MSYILYNVDNRTVHTYSQERPTYYGYDFVFIAGIGVGLLIYKTFFLPASLQQQQQQLQLQQLEEKKKQQEEEDKRQQQQTQQHQQLQQPHKQQPREDSMIKYLKGALVVGIFALGVFVGREPTKQSQPDANTFSDKVPPKKVDDSNMTNPGTDSKSKPALEQATNVNNPAGNASKEPVTNTVNNKNENEQSEEKFYDTNGNNQEVGQNPT